MLAYEGRMCHSARERKKVTDAVAYVGIRSAAEIVLIGS